MLDATISGIVRAFIERAHALNATRAETGETRQGGRIQVKPGATLNRTKVVFDAIALGDPSEVETAVREQIEALAEDGARRVWLVMMEHGATNARLSKKVDLPPADDAPEPSTADNPAINWNDPGAAIGAMASSMITTNKMLQGNNSELLAAVLHLSDERAQLGARALIAEEVGGANAAAERLAMWQSGIDAIAPTLATMGPSIAAGAAAYWTSRAAAEAKAGGPPAEPAEAMAWHVHATKATVQAMAAHVQAHPSALTDPQIAELEQLLGLIGVGLAGLKQQRAQKAAA